MSEDTVICKECGKEVPAELSVCEECGARNFHGRPIRSKPRKGHVAKDTHVAPLTDAMRVVPRAPARQDTGSGRRRKNRDHRKPSRDGAQGSRRLPSVHSDVPRSAASTEESAGDGREIGRLARRKVYRYQKTDKTKSKYGAEIRAMILVLVGGVVLILMCRVADVDSSQTTRSIRPAAIQAEAALSSDSLAPQPSAANARETDDRATSAGQSTAPRVRNSSAKPTVPHTGGK